MKKFWLPTVFAFFLLLTPTAFASDGADQPGFFADLLNQLVALFVGDETGEDPELGLYYPPGGNNATGGEEPEVGTYYPPNG